MTKWAYNAAVGDYPSRTDQKRVDISADAPAFWSGRVFQRVLGKYKQWAATSQCENLTRSAPKNKGNLAMNEQDTHNIETARRMYTGEETERSNIAADITWHVPGHNPVSGDYRGFEAYTQLMPARMAPLTRWEFEVNDVMVNGNYVVATFHLAGERKGKKVDLHGAHIMRFDGRGQVVEGWGFTSDQDALDEFFSG